VGQIFTKKWNFFDTLGATYPPRASRWNFTWPSGPPAARLCQISSQLVQRVAAVGHNADFRPPSKNIYRQVDASRHLSVNNVHSCWGDWVVQNFKTISHRIKQPQVDPSRVKPRTSNNRPVYRERQEWHLINNNQETT